MFDVSHLSKAVDQGIISSEQKEQLISFFQAQETPELSVARDEAPRFFRSFNDLFIGLGVAILGYALSYALGLIPVDNKLMTFAGPLFLAGVFWLLGEWLTAYKRINFPSIIISLFFAFFVVSGFIKLYEFLFLTPDVQKSALAVVTVTGFSTLAIGTFFARFRHGSNR